MVSLVLVPAVLALLFAGDGVWDISNGYTIVGAWMMFLAGLMAFCATFVAFSKD